MRTKETPAVGAKPISSRVWLVILVVVCALLTLWSVYAKREANKGPFWGIKEGRDLRIELLGRVGNTNEIRAEQARARLKIFQINENNPRFLVDAGLQNDELVRITNTGRYAIQSDGFNAATPWYHVEVDQGGRWGLQSGLLMTGPKVILQPGESLEFPVVPPQNARRWRIGMIYQELPASGADGLLEVKSEPNMK